MLGEWSAGKWAEHTVMWSTSGFKANISKGEIVTQGILWVPYKTFGNLMTNHL